ncbi:MAG: cytochrome C [Bacteroidota bacterium]
MKRLIILLTICAVIITACHKKTVPIVSARTEFPEPPKPTQPAINTNTPESMAAGKTIFETKCNRCHDLQDPVAYTTERWTSILKSMIPKARLTEEQAQQVTTYVMANAKK